MEKEFERTKFNPNPPSYELNYYNVRNNAWDFLIKNKVTSFPLNLRAIAENNNWQIWEYDKYCKYSNIDKEALIKEHPKGFTFEPEKGEHVICYNDTGNIGRNRFTICHEFGHIILHSLNYGSRLETEAEMFAARILMPMLLIKELNITTAEQLIKLCNVSYTAATNRMNRYNNEINKRGKFYTNPLEIKLLEQLKGFIENTRRK